MPLYPFRSYLLPFSVGLRLGISGERALAVSVSPQGIAMELLELGEQPKVLAS